MPTMAIPISQHQEQLTALYEAHDLDVLEQLALTLALEPWLHLVRSQRRFDDALAARTVDYIASYCSATNRYLTARQEYRCALEQLRYALVGAGISCTDEMMTALHRLEPTNV